MLMSEARAERVIESIEPALGADLTPQQWAIFRNAARRSPWADHPINLRLSLPFLFGRCYLRIVAGRERRNAERRANERETQQGSSLGAIFLLLFSGLLFGVGGLIAVLLANDMLAF